MNPCIIIPNYNHPQITALLLSLEKYQLPCIMINDGSDLLTQHALEAASRTYPWVHLITFKTNQGKGAAVLAGFEYAAAQHYTHAIQIDADGQHDPEDIPRFLAAVKEHPNALIAGQPIYDQSIPKSRLYGRKITNFWTKLETLSLNLPDALCGYRAYPVLPTLQLMHKYPIHKRMGFDIDIIVRLYWQGIKIIALPTKITYPKNGISHFKLWRDNLAISWLHTRLFFSLVKKLKNNLFNFRKSGQSSQARRTSRGPISAPPRNDENRFCSALDAKQWFELKEKGSLWGMRLTSFVYKKLGATWTHGLLYPITAYFYCFSPAAKKASKDYLAHLPYPSTPFSHFLSFAESLLDKLAVWNNAIKLAHADCTELNILKNLISAKKGGVILTAHLGNIEIARALSQFDTSLKITALLFTQNAKKINSLFKKISPEFAKNLICVEKIDIALAIQLQEKVNAGEFLVIMGDRISVTHPKRAIPAEFLGEIAYFPEGPFILASLLKCPVYFMLCLKQPNQPNKNFNFKIICQFFASEIILTHGKRAEQLAIYTKQYADLLAYYCRLYPLQWFNFFDFWKKPQ